MPSRRWQCEVVWCDKIWRLLALALSEMASAKLSHSSRLCKCSICSRRQSIHAPAAAISCAVPWVVTGVRGSRGRSLQRCPRGMGHLARAPPDLSKMAHPFPAASMTCGGLISGVSCHLERATSLKQWTVQKDSSGGRRRGADAFFSAVMRLAQTNSVLN